MEKKTRKRELTGKQRLFIKEYCVDKNATQACIRAGYSVKIANVHSARMMADPKIRSEIEKELRKIERKVEQRAIISREVLLQTLSHVIEMSSQDVLAHQANGAPVRLADGTQALKTQDPYAVTAAAKQIMDLLGFAHKDMPKQDDEQKNTGVMLVPGVKSQSEWLKDKKDA